MNSGSEGVHTASAAARGFPNLVPGRECGTCVACCQIYEIDEPGLKKPIGVLCSHHTGTGCAIYESRPDACRGFFCLWRRSDALPEELRPDRSGVVFSLSRPHTPRHLFDRLSIVAHAIHDPADLERTPVKAALAWLVADGTLPVWTAFGDRKALHYPQFPFTDAILRPEQTPWQSLVVKALAWRDRYDAMRTVAV